MSSSSSYYHNITKKYTKIIFTAEESHPKRALSFRKANTLKLVNKSDFKGGEDSASQGQKLARIWCLKTDFKTRQYEDQRLDEVISDICMPGAQWKMSSSQPPHPIQLRRQDLTPVAREWAEFIIHSMIPTGNKSEITVARAVLIRSIIKGNDVRVERLIADSI
ncbi:hypothetical protein PIB30_071329 [Stylosanthes scabra]|uniref:Putative plant transposon protein domain-containing protein n=1 Tax=Stylosanthes scabra TaxID=79078 RepID=A0ABU6QPW8_9FABA|nr:hypothetical protein [Stylosanthes scabra]